MHWSCVHGIQNHSIRPILIKKGVTLPSSRTVYLNLTPFDENDVEIHKAETVFQGYAQVQELTVRHGLFGGGTSQAVKRELFISGDAVMVIPYDVRQQTVLLIEQFRVAPLHRREHPWIFEGIAGRIDTDETPETVARREAMEEAGCVLDTMERIGGFYQSPGIFAEHITYYCAKSDLSVAGGIFGLDEENEDIRAVVVPLDEALTAVDENRIVSAPTALSLLWISRNRERLTHQWLTQT